MSVSSFTRLNTTPWLGRERGRVWRAPYNGRRRTQHQACCAPARSTSTTGMQAVEEYNRSMQEQMGWDGVDPYQYHPERGLYYHQVWPNLFCGSQPRSRDDIDKLAAVLGREGSILSLQQDKDLEYWGVNLHELEDQAHNQGLRYLRRPARDFDPHSLRSILPGAAKEIDAELSAGRRLYVHCTAGLGRAPGACIAYFYWFQDFQLADAYKHLTDIRPCGPKWDAIRGATYDLLDGRGWDAFQGLPPISYSELNDNDKRNLRACIAHHY